MHLNTLNVSSLRNISQADLILSPQLNIIYGDNGSGKTSLLEAIYLLGYGRSFRTHTARPIIQDSAHKCTVHAQLNSGERLIHVGIERPRQGGMTIKLAGKVLSGILELVKQFPVQLISPDSYKILEDGPKYRRQYLDWGVFHVEQCFISVWQRFQRALKQRNAALRSGQTLQQIALWDEELLFSALQIDKIRREYLESLQTVISKSLKQLFPKQEIGIHYDCGWDESQSLEQQLAYHVDRDRSLGYTSVGPQRADLRIRLAKGMAKTHMSRGQQKLLICALLFAQAKHLGEQSAKKSILLVDDLCSELDVKRSKDLLSLLSCLDGQIFLTGIELNSLQDLSKTHEVNMFHVEHGQFKMAS